mmetsp:Transcript_15376/g.39219  ORF Transcript_15376/g.39219 Transcript_15376/m.39219 type:complete len:88 (+) Transcript_15376:346-609(+)
MERGARTREQQEELSNFIARAAELDDMLQRCLTCGPAATDADATARTLARFKTCARALLEGGSRKKVVHTRREENEALRQLYHSTCF